MWVFTSKGFVSIVQDWDNRDFLWVRSRTKGQLEQLFPLAKVHTTHKNDYAFRIKLERCEVAAWLARIARDIDYTNFKNSIKDDEYHSACSKVWSAFLSACNTGCYAMSRLAGKKRRGKVLSKSGEEPFDLFDDKSLTKKDSRWPGDQV